MNVIKTVLIVVVHELSISSTSSAITRAGQDSIIDTNVFCTLNYEAGGRDIGHLVQLSIHLDDGDEEDYNVPVRTNIVTMMPGILKLRSFYRSLTDLQNSIFCRLYPRDWNPTVSSGRISVAKIAGGAFKDQDNKIETIFTLPGENVSLKCNAMCNPAANLYEWIVDGSFYSHVEECDQ
ncbi:hypothetical protein ACOME3_009015 [Neoechinorhynchus agilis]